MLADPNDESPANVDAAVNFSLRLYFIVYDFIFVIFQMFFVYRKNGGRDMRISKRKWPDVLGKVKRTAFKYGYRHC